MKKYLKETETKILNMEELLCMKGPLEIPMTNDYLFRALLQENNRVLKALVCALLHLEMESVKEVLIVNPIVLGKSYGKKELHLDVKALLDGNVIINLEMQVVNEHNWEERSLYYLCSSSNHLNRGEGYQKIKSIVHIGFLNFSLFPEEPEFYANFYLFNEKTYKKYSDKLRLAVVDLTQIKLATEDDRAYKIDQWAKFFKCKDWSELVMLAMENEDIMSAVETYYQLSQNEQVRYLCEARLDYERREADRRYMDAKRAEQDAERAKKDAERAKKDAELAKKDAELAEKDAELAEKDAKLEEKDTKLEEKDTKLEEKEQRLKDKEQQLIEKERILKERELEMRKLLQEMDEK